MKTLPDRPSPQCAANPCHKLNPQHAEDAEHVRRNSRLLSSCPRLSLESVESGLAAPVSVEALLLSEHKKNKFLRRMATPFYLTLNFRNTQAIHASTLPWYKRRVSRTVGPVGVDVEWIGLRPDDIAILTARGM